MKNKVLIPSLLIAPALCACHGISITPEEALAIIENINKAIADKPPFDNFVEIYKNKKPTSEIEEKKFFNKELKFFHHYRIVLNSDVSENWTYVKDNYIYDVNRITTGAIDPGDTPKYTITSKVAYSDSAWSEREKTFINDVFSFYSSALNNCKKFVDDTAINVTFSSSNTTSLYTTARQKVEATESKEIVFNYEFKNSQLVFQNRADDENTETYEWSYGEVKIAYPAISE